MIERRSLIAVPAFVSLGMLGCFHAFWGTTLPVLREFLNINIEKAAVLTAYSMTAHATACLLGGFLCDIFRRDKILLIGCFLLGSGTFFLGSLTSYQANLVLISWMGLGGGLILSASNALLVGLFHDRKGPIMNILHSTYGLVSLLSPLLMAYLLEANIGWNRGYYGLGCILAGVCLVFLFTNVPVQKTSGRTTYFRDTTRLLTSGNFIPLMLISFFALGAQIALIFLGVSYLIEEKGFILWQAGAVLSSFMACLFIGRLVCSALAFKIASSRIIITLLFFQVVCLTITWQGSGWIAALALAFAGFGFSGIFPSLLALTGTMYFRLAGTAMGILASALWVGGMFIVWAAGLLAERVSLQLGFITIVTASAAAFVVFLFKYKTFIREECVSSDGSGDAAKPTECYGA